MNLCNTFVSNARKRARRAQVHQNLHAAQLANTLQMRRMLGQPRLSRQQNQCEKNSGARWPRQITKKNTRRTSATAAFFCAATAIAGVTGGRSANTALSAAGAAKCCSEAAEVSFFSRSISGEMAETEGDIKCYWRSQSKRCSSTKTQTSTEFGQHVGVERKLRQCERRIAGQQTMLRTNRDAQQRDTGDGGGRLARF